MGKMLLIVVNIIIGHKSIKQSCPINTLQELQEEKNTFLRQY